MMNSGEKIMERILPGGRKMVGLDIGTSSIKVSQITHRGKRVRVGKTAIWDNNRDSEGEIQGNLENRIGELFSINNISTGGVVSTLTKDSITEKFISVPPAREKIRDIVRWEVPKHIDFPFREAVFDYRSELIPGTESVSVHIAISRRKELEEFIRLLTNVGIRPRALETRSRALQRVAMLEEGIGEKSVAVLDMGSRWSTLILLNSGVLRMTRTMEIGSDDINHSIVQLVKCSEEEAESLKQKVGISRDILHGERVQSTSDSFQVFSAIEHQMDRVVAEVKRSLVFHFARYEDEPEPEAIYLMGGSSRIPNLEVFLNSKFDMDVEAIDPLKRLKGENEISPDEGTRLSMAIGLALRGYGSE